MRRSATPYVLLGILASFGPRSGYEIREVISRSIGNFWSESFGQIYPHLKRLAAEGSIVPVEQEARLRDRRRFQITDAGRERLAAWAKRPPQPVRPRHELILKLMFGEFSGPDATREMLAAERRMALRAFDIADAGQLDRIERDKSNERLVYALIVTDAGRVMADARRRWAERALSLLEAKESGGDEAVLERMRELREMDDERMDVDPLLPQIVRAASR